MPQLEAPAAAVTTGVVEASFLSETRLNCIQVAIQETDSNSREAAKACGRRPLEPRRDQSLQRGSATLKVSRLGCWLMQGSLFCCAVSLGAAAAPSVRTAARRLPLACSRAVAAAGPLPSHSVHNHASLCQLLQPLKLEASSARGPSAPTRLSGMQFFSAADSARRDARNKWIEAAAQAVKGSAADGTPQRAPDSAYNFVVNGTEILLSTSPAVPGHSILLYKGEREKVFDCHKLGGRPNAQRPTAQALLLLLLRWCLFSAGLVEGSAVRGRNALELWRQQLQQTLGGEQQLLQGLLQETRAAALQRLAEAAAAAGANAVVSVRLVTSGLQRMHVEYAAYGTAVRVAKAGGGPSS